MNGELQARIEAYLDGELAPDDSRALEQELLMPGARRALAEELLLREFLRTQPPDEAPAGLCDRIAEALDRERGRRSRSRSRSPSRSVSAGQRLSEHTREPAVEKRHGARELAHTALSAAGWMVRGPAMSVREQRRPLRPVLAGFATYRYALGPLIPRRKVQPRRPWWRRALGRLGRAP